MLDFTSSPLRRARGSWTKRAYHRSALL